MPQREKYVPKHRSAPARPQPAQATRAAVRSGLVWSTVAVAATGTTIGSGVLAGDPASSSTQDLGETLAASATLSEPQSIELPERETPVSRSDRRGEEDPAKAAALGPVEAEAVTGSQDLSDADPRDVARALLPQYGFSADQFGCLDSLWVSESDWRVDADNPVSSAYGIPQALTGGTHDDLPADYMTNPVSQIEWGLGYIRDAYGSPCSAWSFKQANNWY
ncbi:lytic transglycosylase domain-containing protein [Nocardioides perillae]|uniref:Transglycosylase SLT domain-containing protein n=1 Tax=Nocardioides perillae TaxID=1119534 RepID=A0A7Y9UVE4_9ACTN|nr:lytic transglycosylase domain-containing protein [Nocardioides perillae]NYG56760.1 hypothetical protein [Nocardioides perillae]